MRTVLKRLVISAYCHGWIAAGVVSVSFRLFALRDA
jgi:hypothetical protein